MDLTTFRTGSLLHFTCLLVCGLVVFGSAWIGRRRRDSPAFRKRFRWFVAGGCLVTWLINAAYMAWPTSFDWRWSLPLHFCNLANLIGAIAVFTRYRLPKALIYFWALVLCIWAFVTPIVSGGPAHATFWVFWAYHLFILLALVDIFVVQQFRPNWTDFRNAWLFTVAFTATLAILNRWLGWDYGFVGPATPDRPTLLDMLGPYPLRLLWMLLMGTAAFALLVLPWQRSAKDR